ncbi:hypothetical protein INR49_000778 [Caranx melampygus]|nr:hypothetical protein INR49_000778 [Caranx melampygus]
MCFNTKLLSTIEPQELQCLLPTRLNNVNWKQWSVSCACLGKSAILLTDALSNLHVFVLCVCFRWRRRWWSKCG